MTNSNTLSFAELDLVSGGVRDNPDSDATNRRAAAANGAEGTYGGSLGSVFPGLVGSGSGSNTPGHPITGL
jgi:hypothetical protein